LTIVGRPCHESSSNFINRGPPRRVKYWRSKCAKVSH
jgi:hypothetical protein